MPYILRAHTIIYASVLVLGTGVEAAKNPLTLRQRGVFKIRYKNHPDLTHPTKGSWVTLQVPSSQGYPLARVGLRRLPPPTTAVPVPLGNHSDPRMVFGIVNVPC